MAIIAIDCDDTLALTNATICDWHNETYGTNLTLSTFTHFQYWRNPGWGNRTETMRKVHEFNGSAAWKAIPPIQEAISGIHALKKQGHTLIIITARMESEALGTRDWIEKHFGVDTFSAIYFTSAFETRAAGEKHETNTTAPSKSDSVNQGRLAIHHLPKPKSQVCKAIGARMLVDDSLQNADDVWKNAGVPVALYGEWAWNKTALDPESADNPMGYQERIDKGLEDKQEPAELPEGIKRCLTWDKVLEFVDEKFGKGEAR